MNKKLASLNTAWAALTLATTGLVAQSSTSLTIHTAIEVEYPTEIGKIYTLQGTTDFETWVDIGSPQFGDGKVVSRIFSTKNGTEVNFASYRLAETSNEVAGFAPWIFVDLIVQMDDQPGDDLMHFTTETEGLDLSLTDSDPFTYHYSRTGENEGRTEIVYSARKRDVVYWTFTSETTGTWNRDEFRDDVLKDRDNGVFQILDALPFDPNNPNNPPVDPPMPPNPPQSLAGLSYLFHTGGTPDQLIFQTNESGIEIEDNPKEDDDNPNKFFTYSYVLTSESSATLIVNLPNNRRDEYFLTFTLGQQGTFLREEYRDDRLDDTDRGAFSPTNLPSDLPPPPAEFNSLPNQIQGLTLTAFSGEDPERLVFQTASSGVEFDDSAPSQFTYSWSSTGEKLLQLIVTFKTDKWDEYSLTYTEAQGGSFVRREFKKGELDDTDTGRFTLTPTN